MGLVIGIIGVVFRLNGMTVNTMASSFTEGARMMIAPALLVGFAKGILLLVGNGEAGDASVLNTILNSIANAISGLDNAVAALVYVALRAVFNFFVTSGSGQAALTMPLLAPLGDLVGVNRQVTVLAFQFGDGFSHIIYPTSASLMATLGVCRVDFRNWLKVGATPAWTAVYYVQRRGDRRSVDGLPLKMLRAAIAALFHSAVSVSTASFLALRFIHNASAFSESGVNSSQRAVISSGVSQQTSLTSSSCRAKGP